MDIKDLISEVIKKKTKFIVTTGGVCSSLGKGVLISSLGVLLKNSGYKVSVVKWDPYLNIDPGTMSPLVHGEVFVLDDGAETDLDLGHYERMLGVHLHKDSSVSSGQIFKEILDAERAGKFLGKNIQLVPHVVDAIKARLLNFALKTKVDFVLLEIGGTVGDMEGTSFLEAIRQLKLELSPRQMMLCHLSLVPYLNWANEIKTKPTQHSVMLLQKAGLVPDAIFLRTDKSIDLKAKEKVAIMCGVKKDYIFEVLTFDPVYQLFLELEKQKVNQRIQKWFEIKKIQKADLSRWQELIEKIKKAKGVITIGLVAKYTGSNDPYLSVLKALEAAGYYYGYKIDVKIFEAEKLEQRGLNLDQIFKGIKGIVVPGGFDARGIEGKITAVKWARENNVPYFGLCLGMQVMLIEFARSVLKFKDANSTEFDKKTKHPIVCFLEEQREVKQKGGTMRLGSYPCTVLPETLAYKAYKEKIVFERHRHRYEFNNFYKEKFEKADVVFSGIYKDKNLVEIAEIKNYDFMLGTQFHPELLSSPLRPHPLFKEFLHAIINRTKKK
jgi:CTP synthase